MSEKSWLDRVLREPAPKKERPPRAPTPGRGDPLRCFRCLEKPRHKKRSYCLPCARDYQREYYWKAGEKFRKKRLDTYNKWREKNGDRYRANQRRWRDENREKVREYSRRYLSQEKNLERKAKYDRMYRELNKEYFLEKARRYRTKKRMEKEKNENGE